MARRISTMLVLSASVVVSQFLPMTSARAEAQWKKDKAEWMKLCMSRLPEYNRLRAGHGFQKWTRKKADGKCGYAWAVAKPENHTARHARMIEETKSECFLTTACCDAMGLADNCFELTTLRQFRDEVMMASADGADEVLLYYAIAPEIVRSLQRGRQKSETIDLYYRYVLPCVFLAKVGLNSHARRLYRKMVIALHMKYAMLAAV